MARLDDEWAEEVADVTAHRLKDPTRRNQITRDGHCEWSPSSRVTISAIAALTALGAVSAAVGIQLLAPDTPVATTNISMQATQQGPPFTQRGTIVAITAGTLTTRTSDWSIQTFQITPSTTAITADGTQSGSVTSLFAVNDSVSIVAAVRDGTVVATAVADLGTANLNGPPMDFVSTQPEGKILA